MYRNSTPTAAGRRSTRSARGSAKRRRNEGSSRKQRLEEVAQRPAKKWVEVLRAPAPGISFRVKTWVPYSELTHLERSEYEEKLEMEREERLKEAAKEQALAPDTTEEASDTAEKNDMEPQGAAVNSEEPKQPEPPSN